MSDPLPNFISNPKPMVGDALPTAVTPQSIAALIAAILKMEPTGIQVLQALYPNNAALSAAISLLPTILPVIQEIETILAAF